MNVSIARRKGTANWRFAAGAVAEQIFNYFDSAPLTNHCAYPNYQKRQFGTLSR